MLTNEDAREMSPDQEMRFRAWQERETTPKTEWRWGWSGWMGIHYGPIPVGILIGLPLLALLRMH